jgi:hypothetical protein
MEEFELVIELAADSFSMDIGVNYEIASESPENETANEEFI